MRLLTPRDQRLPKVRANRLSAKQAEKSGSRLETEELLRMRRAQPLEVDWQLRRVEALAGSGKGKGGRGERRSLCDEFGRRFAIPRAKPTINPPHHRLNRRLATE